MGWAQIAYIAVLCLSVGIHLAKHGEKRTDSYNVVYALTGAGISVGLVWAGGFFG